MPQTVTTMLMKVHFRENETLPLNSSKSPTRPKVTGLNKGAARSSGNFSNIATSPMLSDIFVTGLIFEIYYCQPVEGSTQGYNGNNELWKEATGCVHRHPTWTPFFFFNQIIFFSNIFLVTFTFHLTGLIVLGIYITIKNLIMVWSPLVAIAISFSKAT